MDKNVPSGWIKVDLRSDKVVTGFATQGYGEESIGEWVTRYMAFYNNGYGKWTSFQDEDGNSIVSGMNSVWLLQLCKGLSSDCGLLLHCTAKSDFEYN